jgi:hypothetical protein
MEEKGRRTQEQAPGAGHRWVGANTRPLERRNQGQKPKNTVGCRRGKHRRRGVVGAKSRGTQEQGPPQG